MYIHGSVDISKDALSKLEEIGIKPEIYPYYGKNENAGKYNSFELPEEFEDKFHYKRGTPSYSGTLKIKEGQ